MPDYDLIAILGPTASGKTPFAAALASELNTEIISADSRQIYRGMDLGTGKDLADYTVNGRQIPYHLIDIADPGYKYNVFEYQRDFLKAYETIKQKGCLPVLCGGTSIRCFVDGLIEMRSAFFFTSKEPKPCIAIAFPSSSSCVMSDNKELISSEVSLIVYPSLSASSDVNSLLFILV